MSMDGNGREDESRIGREPFGEHRGKPVTLFILRNDRGVMAKITNYGGIVTHLTAPDAQGDFADVVLGYDNLKDYQENSPYFGALIGRYANRIAGAQFTLDGETYRLDASQPPNTLHGGRIGFHDIVWDSEPFDAKNGQGLVLMHTSPDGTEGFPGTLSVRVIYFLSDENELQISYEATTDRPTPVAMTHHSYFNLTGDLGKDILGHEVQIKADTFTPVDKNQIPTGDIAPVADTPFDFMHPRTIGERIEADHEQLQRGGGYDHNYVLTRKGEGLEQVASVTEPDSGRRMEVLTTEPGVQFYTGNNLGEDYRGKGVTFGKFTGLCLETQHFPDSPNQPDFPSTILRPGETYHSKTVYRFSTV